ncbi:MAG TPA: methyltransferase domain-containing protein [Vicinamibacterales bacterium]|nr:methyltransferase domain-containing protein [Vicinamibacterales bacterium]
MTQALYDQIGATYTSTRRPDPRIAAAIRRGLGQAVRVVNVGAGAGAYEPADRLVVAVEPSRRMIEQRPAGAAAAIQASAEALPFQSGTFDAGLAVLTLHHWSDWRRGLDEIRRVADRLVICTFELEDLGNFWLTQRYFPEIVELSRGQCPSVDDVAAHIGTCRVESVPVPHDCVDGFLAAYWRRPEAYLDSSVRAGMSGFSLLGAEVVTRGIARLHADLESGEWDRRFGDLRQLEAIDVCYRLLVTT